MVYCVWLCGVGGGWRVVWVCYCCWVLCGVIGGEGVGCGGGGEGVGWGCWGVRGGLGWSGRVVWGFVVVG
uniref:Uncharacterized protein n=1 Tax=Knipowitschia caucasica TaxID=637954 RepID=A0AAV2JXJ9_KNICA